MIKQYNPCYSLIDPFSFLGTLQNLIFPNLIREHIFDLIEQVCFAAIQCHRYQLRNDCLFILEKYFKGSVRVQFIRASIYESAEKYDDAVRVYRSIIHDNRSSLYSLKAKQRLPFPKNSTTSPNSFKTSLPLPKCIVITMMVGLNCIGLIWGWGE